MAANAAAAAGGSVSAIDGECVVGRPYPFHGLVRRAAIACAAALVLLPRPASAASSVHDLGTGLALWTVLPFVATLLAIAILPLAAARWWEHNLNKAKVAAALALPVTVFLMVSHGATGAHVLLEKAMEYTSFMVLLLSLFVITGGVHIRGSLSGTPLLNTAILGLGAGLASFIGTTGASMLLIRPLLRANEPRERKVHLVVFFIFIVSNCGGLLTPLGDPPLFLGYLNGVPFEWTLGLWKPWLLVNGGLLLVFSVWDQIVFAREELRRPGSQLEDVQRHEPVSIRGAHNFAFLLGIVGVIYASGSGWMNAGESWPFGVQEAGMLALAIGAWKSTDIANRAANRFAWTPIVEVAVLFAGIFITMAPALLILNAWGQGHREVLGAPFGLREPWEFFWGTGTLSGFLDNAPTYLTLAAMACGIEGVPVEGRYLAEFLARGEEAATRLAAISCGAVFMGANTYIGNGPNFMVKAIAEENGVRMPSFFGYALYSAAILLPLFALVTVLFFAP